MTAPAAEPPSRRDVVRNRAAILRAASELLGETEAITVQDIAARAGVSRATVYRHFASVSVLLEEAAQRAVATLPAAGPTDVATVLAQVPPHQLPEQIVSEAGRLGRLRAVALYLVDIDGSRLLRAAGSRELPDTLALPLAVGPEIPPEGLPVLVDEVRTLLPNVTVVPVSVRDRAIGAIVAIDDAEHAAELAHLARHAGTALALGERFTDVIGAARRRRETTAAAETQQLLLAPRIVRLAGLDLAANVIPGYENGGNWFDHAENADGAWIAAVDTMGSGARAAAISAVALGALRARRHIGSTPVDAVGSIDACLRDIGLPDARCALFVARWHGPTSTLFHVAAGGLGAVHSAASGDVGALAGGQEALVGSGETPRSTAHVRLRAGDRIVLVSDAIAGAPRSALAPGELGELLRATTGMSPARTVQAIEREVRAAVAGDLADDAMTLVLAPAGPGRSDA